MLGFLRSLSSSHGCFSLRCSGWAGGCARFYSFASGRRWTSDTASEHLARLCIVPYPVLLHLISSGCVSCFSDFCEMFFQCFAAHIAQPPGSVLVSCGFHLGFLEQAKLVLLLSFSRGVVPHDLLKLLCVGSCYACPGALSAQCLAVATFLRVSFLFAIMCVVSYVTFAYLNPSYL